jgi:excisionase family DNA binding protein
LRAIRKRLQLLEKRKRQASNRHNESQAFLEILLPICCQISRAASSTCSTVRQVAQLLGVCRATVYKWAADGVLRHVRIVNVIRIRREDLNRLLSAGALTLPAPPRPSQ